MTDTLDKSSYLGEHKISRLLLKFSIPCILSLLISLLYNIVDKIFIGNSALDTSGSAGIGVCFAMPIVAIAFAWFFGDGTATYLSVCQGKKDTSNAHKAVGNAILASLLASIVLIAILIPLKTPILTLFGADSNSLPYAIEYFVILVAGFPLYMVSNTMNAIIRADGSPTYALIAMAAGAVANIIFDAIFIIPCNMGMTGAAAATVIGQGISLILCSIYFLRSKTFKLSLKSFIPDVKVFLHTLKLGVPTLITQLAIVAMSLSSSMIFKKYGGLSQYGSTIAIAAMTDENTIFTVVLNIVIGIVLGAQPIISYNYGAGNYDRVKRTFFITLIAVSIVALISTIFAEACPQILFGMFGNSDHLYVEFASQIFRYFFSTMILTCIIKMFAIFLQAVGSPIKSAIITIVRDIMCFVTLICTLPLALGLKGAFIAPPIGDAISMVVSLPIIILFFIEFKKKTTTTTISSDNSAQ